MGKSVSLTRHLMDPVSLFVFRINPNGNRVRLVGFYRFLLTI
jgi:hypothetical protein